MRYLYVAIGATFGAPARFIVDQYVKKYWRFPAGILLVNVLGAFFVGLTLHAGATSKLLIATGFSGAFTTWSTFVLDLYLGYELKAYKSTALNLIASLVLGLLAAKLGIALAK